MRQIKFIEYGSSDYEKTLELRNKIMRIPLGLSIYNEDFSVEKNSIIIGMFEDNLLLGVGVMSHKNNIYKVEYLCIDSSIQKSGIGGILLDKLENIAKNNNAIKIFMDARVSAKQFYLKHGYQPVADLFHCVFLKEIHHNQIPLRIR